MAIFDKKTRALKCHVCKNCSLTFDQNSHKTQVCKPGENVCGIEFVSDNTYSKTCTTIEACEIFSKPLTSPASPTLETTHSTLMTTSQHLSTEPFTLYMICCNENLCNKSINIKLSLVINFVIFFLTFLLKFKP